MGKWLWLVGLPCIAGCGPKHFLPPASSAPHALLRVAAVYDTDPSLGDRQPEQQVLIDGRSIWIPETLAPLRSSAGATAPVARGWSRELRLSPGYRQFSFRAYFEHPELRNEMIRPSVPACMPNRSSGYAPNDCAILTQAQPTSFWQWEIDAECDASAFLEVGRGEEIRLTFRFESHGKCRVECVRRAAPSLPFAGCSG